MAQKLSQVELYEANKKSAAQARQDEIQLRNYNGAQNFDELYDGLSAAEIKFLYTYNESFHTTTDLLNDPQRQTLAQSPEEAAEIRDQARAAEQNRLFAEAREAAEANAREEKLYPGVEKLADGRYRLTIDPEDGSAPEVFLGATQAEVWQKLRDSKKNATRELRRRAGQVKITQELREMSVDVVEYAPLEAKVTLTPAELFEATEMLKDPSTSIEGTRRLQAAARTQADIDRANEGLVRGRQIEAQTIAEKWLRDNPAFYANDHNIGALREIMGTLNWAVTPKNLSLAHNALIEQGILVDRLPESEVEAPMIQPRPRPAVFVPPAAVPAPVVPQAQRPTVPLRRPTTHDPSRESFARRSSASIKAAPMTATEYHSISSGDMKTRYNQDANFKDRVDAYWANGGR
jgi:hypothetical protein